MYIEIQPRVINSTKNIKFILVEFNGRAAPPRYDGDAIFIFKFELFHVVNLIVLVVVNSEHIGDMRRVVLQA